MRLILNDIDINYEVKGKGNNILLLHGWNSNIKVFNDIFNNLSKNNRVYMLDLPGFGESEEMNKPWNIDNYVDFIISFINHFEIKKVSLIGHSFGGRIIIKLMNKKLDFKVDKIVLMGSAGIRKKLSLKRKSKVGIYKVSKKIVFNKATNKLFPNALDKFKTKIGSTDYKEASPIMRESLVLTVNEDLESLLPNINVPTLLVWGTNDTETPYADALTMEKLIPNAGLVTISGGSHYAFLEDTVTVNKVLDKFLTVKE